MTLAQLREKRANLLREAEGLKRADGTFADEPTRSAFDAKMTELEALDAQIRTAEAAERAAAQPAPASTDALRAQVRAEEATRAATIRDAVRAAGLEASYGDSLIGNQAMSVDQARAAIIGKLAERSNAGHVNNQTITMGEDARDKFARGATNWLLRKAGYVDMVARAAKQAVDAFDPGEFRGMTLIEIARESLTRAGVNTRGMDKMQIAAMAFTHRTSGGNIMQGTSDFTTALESVLHKVLQAAYATQTDTWSRFCNTSTVSDFRAHTRYRMGSIAALDSLNELGEFKNKAITDAEKATITAATKGNIVSVSRAVVINDDIGFVTGLTAALGRAAKRSVEIDVYALLAQNSGLGPTMADSLTLFHASHGNLTAGAALSAAAIDADRVAMALQKDKDGNDYLDLRPSVLVIGAGLGGQARVINQSQYDPDTLANKSQMKPNVVAGLFSDIVDSPRVTAISATRRYLFADKSVAPVLEVAYLEGETEPVLETQTGWRVDGSEMRVRYDYGVAAVDFRGAVTNAGV